MGSDIHIRHVLAHDLDDVATIERNSYESPWGIDAFALHLRRLSNHVRVAVWKGDAIGYYAVRHVGPKMRLMRLAVDPRFRHQRVGTELVADLILQAHNNDATSIVSELSSHNDAGMIFLAQFGFKFVRTLSNGAAMRFTYHIPTGKTA